MATLKNYGKPRSVFDNGFVFDFLGMPKYGALAKLYFGEQFSEVKEGTENSLSR